ncbi:ribonuclease J [Candidatus Uhrbacteria bacterium]|nr:ribonuclease J [Candidatus Uhrbacteria bacterium]
MEQSLTVPNVAVPRSNTRTTRPGTNRRAPNRPTGLRRLITTYRNQRPRAPLRPLPTRLPPVAANAATGLRIMALGGLEEVGRNCMLIEYGQDILIIDLGLQFPEEDMPGIDYIIPNVSYLKGKERNIRGVIITHGHYDHIGGIPHLMGKLGNPTIYGTPLTLGIIRKRQDDYKSAAPLNLQEIRAADTVLQLGIFKVEFFGVTHNIPDSMGVIVHTPEGIVVHTGDFKLDLAPSGDTKLDIAKIASLNDKNVLLLMQDSTNSTQTGHQLSEAEIQHNLDDIIANAPGRLIIATFASMIGRVKQIIQAAERLNRKVIIEGYGMRTNIEIASELGYLKFDKSTIIPVQEMHKYPDNRVVVLCTGAQGEDRAVLMRIVNHEHRTITIQPGDTVVFSSSVIPGNERSVQRLKDALYREGAEVIHYQMMDVHAGGHAKQEDLKLMYRLVNPKYFMPIEGNHSFLRVHGKLIQSMGHPKEQILIADNGQVIEFKGALGRVTNERIPAEYVFVDGLGVGDTNQVVIRDRQMLSDDGMVVIIATVDGKTGRLIGSPDIISRGFIYMKEHKELVERMRGKIKGILRDGEPKMAADDDEIKNKLRNDIGQFLFSMTQRRPMILPVIIKV